MCMNEVSFFGEGLIKELGGFHGGFVIKLVKRAGVQVENFNIQVFLIRQQSDNDGQIRRSLDRTWIVRKWIRKERFRVTRDVTISGKDLRRWKRSIEKRRKWLRFIPKVLFNTMNARES